MWYLSSAERAITHTFTVTGRPSEEEAPEFTLYVENSAPKILAGDMGEVKIGWFSADNSHYYGDDEFGWAVEQTSGAPLQAEMRNDRPDTPALIALGDIPAGE